MSSTTGAVAAAGAILLVHLVAGLFPPGGTEFAQPLLGLHRGRRDQPAPSWSVNGEVMNDRRDGEAAGEYGIAPAGFRLPAATRVGRVRLQVADLAKSLEFYRDVLGLRVLERSEAAVTLGAHQTETPLVELVERAGATPVPRRGRLGLFHFAILLPDRPALGRFVAHLASVGMRSGASDHLVSEALYLQDPDGLGIEGYADRPRSAWRYEDRQLVMATEPLDLDSVAGAGGGEPWEGMPGGTTIGHLHLHVGDLDVASAFYHEALGLDRVVWNYPGALFLSAGGYHHHLGLNTWAAGAEPAAEGDVRLLEWELLVPSEAGLTRAFESLIGAGYPVERGRNGGVVRDPWGTALRIRVAATEPTKTA